MKKKLSEPNEDYLERICELLDSKSYARVTDIAEELKVKPASVTAMLRKLENDGYVIREAYRGFSLTKEGSSVGKKIQKRHEILTRFLTFLKVDPKVVAEDIDGLEHHLSDQTLIKLENFLNQMAVK